MKEIGLEELKKIELDILSDIVDFCEANKIIYFLCGGSLLGAIRHKGFIPWDDDIDIMMPREEYDRFVSSYNNKAEHKYYEAHSCSIDKNYWRTHCQVFDKRTSLDEDTFNSKVKDDAVFVDVFPIDGVPNCEVSQKIYFYLYLALHAMHFGSILKNKQSAYYGYGKSLKNTIRTFIKSLFIFVFKYVDYRKIISLCDKFARIYDYNESEYVALVAEYGDWGTRGIVPREIYNSSLLVDFENLKVRIPIGYDVYLRHVYGNYMELPPIEDQVCKHWAKAYWKQ